MENEMNDYKIGTKCVQAGYTPGEWTAAADSDHPVYHFQIRAPVRTWENCLILRHPDISIHGCRIRPMIMVAAKIAEMEGGTAAMLTSTGQAANFFAIFNICESGDHIVASSSIYGGTFNLIAVTLDQNGDHGNLRSLRTASEEELNAAFRPNTRADVWRDDRQSGIDSI